METQQPAAAKTPVKKGSAYVCILAAAALWGIGGVWNRNLMAGGLAATSVVMLRNFGGMLLLGILFGLRDRKVFRIKPRDLKYFFGTGVISVILFTVCYFYCQDICSLAVASTLLYTAPSFVVILSAILWKEPITRKKGLALVLTLVGCAFVCGLFAGGVSVTLPGLLLGIGAGFFYALYSIFGRYALQAGYGSITTTVWTFVFAGFGSLVFLRPGEVAAAMTTPSMWLLTLGLVVFSTAAPYLLYTVGLSKVESGKAAIMASLEPVISALTGVVMFGEPLSAMTVVGIACVLAGVYILR